MQAPHSCDLWLKEKHLCNNTSHFLCNSCTLQFFADSQMASRARNTFYQLSILADARSALITSCCPPFDCVSSPCRAEAFAPVTGAVQTAINAVLSSLLLHKRNLSTFSRPCDSQTWLMMSMALLPFRNQTDVFLLPKSLFP